jgi:hypothetical protein
MQFGIAAARVGIDLGFDQFEHGRLAVAGDGDQVAAVGGDQLAADDQQAVLDALDGALDQHAGAFLDSDGVGLAHFFRRGQVDEDAAAMVAVGRLDDHRQADVLGRIEASSALSTSRPSGTGTPTEEISSLVRSLSREMVSAMALVLSVSAVQMRRMAAP